MMFRANMFRDRSSGLAMSGGRAAAQFSMELRRSAQHRQSVSRNSAWIGYLLAATPRLSAGLRYDGILAPLLNAILSPAERQSAHPAASRSFTRPILSGGHSRGTADSSAGARTRLSTASLALGAQTAAGATSVSPNRAHQGNAPAEFVRLAQSSNSGGAVAEVSRKGRLPALNSYAYRRESRAAAAAVIAESVVSASRSSEAAAAGLPTPAEIRDWQSRMVERVRGRLRSSFGGYGAIAAASHAMHDVWGLAIEAPASSPEVLSMDAGFCAASANTVFDHAIDSSPAESFIAPAAAELPASDGSARTELSTKVGRPSILENVVASPEGAALAALQVLGEELLSKTNDDLWMPALIPSRRPGEVPCTASPASLAKTEIAPLNQDIDLGEDLTVLSRNMKRVLNEEARRHGIDV